MEDSDYLVRSASTDIFGRVLLTARDQHLVVDGPVQNGCPGEAITPAELFLGGVAACGSELVGVIAKERGIEIGCVTAEVGGTVDRRHAVRPDVTIFKSVDLRFELQGVNSEDAAGLIKAFKGR
jgi:uncharacterized OsmC-like protein